MGHRIKKYTVWSISIIMIVSILAIPFSTIAGSENSDVQNDPSYLFSLELSEYGEYLEEGPIPAVMINEFNDAGYDTDEGSELLEKNDIWWVLDEGIKRYRMELDDDLINIYTPFTFEINRPEKYESYVEGEEISLNFTLTVDQSLEQELTIVFLVDGFDRKDMDINITKEQDEYHGEFIWFTAGEPREAELGVRIENYKESEVSVHVEVSEIETFPFWLIILLFGVINIIVVMFFIFKEQDKDPDKDF